MLLIPFSDSFYFIFCGFFYSFIPAFLCPIPLRLASDSPASAAVDTTSTVSRYVGIGARRRRSGDSVERVTL